MPPPSKAEQTHKGEFEEEWRRAYAVMACEPIATNGGPVEVTIKDATPEQVLQHQLHRSRKLLALLVEKLHEKGLLTEQELDELLFRACG